MSRFRKGDVVQFIGNPSHQFEVGWSHEAVSTVDLRWNIPDHEMVMETVPDFLLERVPVQVKVGQVWKGHDPDEGDYRLFVSRVDNHSVTHTSNWDAMTSVHSVEWVRDNHELELDVEP